MVVDITFITVLMMSTNIVTPTASTTLMGKINAQKLTVMSCPAHTNGGERVTVYPVSWSVGVGDIKRIISTGATGSNRLTSTKPM